MTYEELLDVKLAIEKLERDMRTYNVDVHDYVTVEELVVAIQCIEKQIAKKPILEADGYSDGELVYDTWFCPNCDKSYEVDFDDYDFCPNCGQHILWEDEE